MLSFYANENIGLKVKGVVDGANEATYSETVIAGRLQYKKLLVRNDRGELVQSDSQLFTAFAIKVGDLALVDGLEIPVIAVEPVKGLDGQIKWREAYL